MMGRAMSNRRTAHARYIVLTAMARPACSVEILEKMVSAYWGWQARLSL